jgi:hypothetical protein
VTNSGVRPGTQEIRVPCPSASHVAKWGILVSVGGESRCRLTLGTLGQRLRLVSAAGIRGQQVEQRVATPGLVAADAPGEDPLVKAQGPRPGRDDHV